MTNLELSKRWLTMRPFIRNVEKMSGHLSLYVSQIHWLKFPEAATLVIMSVEMSRIFLMKKLKKYWRWLSRVWVLPSHCHTSAWCRTRWSSAKDLVNPERTGRNALFMLTSEERWELFNAVLAISVIKICSTLRVSKFSFRLNAELELKV